MTWALAGHPAPVLLDEGRALNGIGPGLPLGVNDSVDCDSAEHHLSGGDGVLLFTDGLLEARRHSPGGSVGAPDRESSPLELFGSERIAAVLSEHRGEEPGEVVRALRAAAERSRAAAWPTTCAWWRCERAERAPRRGVSGCPGRPPVGERRALP